MEIETITTTMDTVKKLFISKQYLAGNSPSGNFNEKLTSIIRDIGYIQWDPVTVVAPSHLISIWSRIGKFKRTDLDKMMWEDKEAIFQWVPTAWIVLTEDYPIFYSLMKRFPESLQRGWASYEEMARNFLDSHQELRSKVLEKLKQGSTQTAQLTEFGKKSKSSDGWGYNNEVTQLLFFLQMSGEVMVSGHSGNQNIWSLTENYLPEWAEKTVLSVEELERKAAMKALRALGVASEGDIYRYFVRGRYTNLKPVLKDLLNEGKLVKVEIKGQAKGKTHYMLSEDKAALESLINGIWEPNLNLVSPFDNMITLRDRMKRMFNFDYILEQFVPREKRKYGTYVLPVLWDHDLVGRMDVKLDKGSRTLNINAIYAEPGFEENLEIGPKLGEKIADFGEFLEAEKIVIGTKRLELWSRYFE